eukprot:g3688.t1
MEALSRSSGGAAATGTRPSSSSSSSSNNNNMNGGGASALGTDEMEEQFILRLPDELANKMHQKIDDLSSEFEGVYIEALDKSGKKMKFHFDGNVYRAKMVNLPCIIESYRTVDRNSYYKSQDISQMVQVVPQGSNLEKELEDGKTGSKSSGSKRLEEFPDGLTPPMKNIKEKRWQKTEFMRQWDAHVDERNPQAAKKRNMKDIRSMEEEIRFFIKGGKGIESYELVEYEDFMDDFPDGWEESKKGHSMSADEYKMMQQKRNTFPPISLEGGTHSADLSAVNSRLGSRVGSPSIRSGRSTPNSAPLGGNIRTDSRNDDFDDNLLPDLFGDVGEVGDNGSADDEGGMLSLFGDDFNTLLPLGGADDEGGESGGSEKDKKDQLRDLNDDINRYKEEGEALDDFLKNELQDLIAKRDALIADIKSTEPSFNPSTGL